MGRIAAICLLLAVATVAVYSNVHRFDFINIDDQLYATENENIQAGLTGESVRWAFTTGHGANWHPLTWLSHTLDVELFGMWAGGHHVTNALLHLLNVLLLFCVVRAMTGAVWRSALVAAIFALHPIAVESVAWISERKNVLSTAFWLATMWAYVWYVRRPGGPGAWRYFAVFVLLALGLMCKPMLVTLPCVLVLLDYWPLDRGRSFGTLIVEKLPLLALSVASSVVTFAVQGSGGAIAAAHRFPLLVRCQNALVSYLRYLGKLIWPSDLSVYYPFPGPIGSGMWPLWLLLLAAYVLVCGTLAAIYYSRHRRYRYVTVGWFWYLGTLVPVIGLVVQTGGQAMADRYMYVPMIGLLIAAVWAGADLIRHRRAMAAAVVVLLIALGASSWRQVQCWHDSTTLLTHSIEATGGDWMTHYCLGCECKKQGRLGEALRQFRRAARFNPINIDSAIAIGSVLLDLGQSEAAVAQFEYALSLKPGNAEANIAMAVALSRCNRIDEARRYARRVLQIDPAHDRARQLFAELGP